MSAWDSTGLSPKDQPRFDYVNRDQIPEELKEVFDSIVGSQRGVGTLSNGALPGPFNGWMYTDPEMARALDGIGMAVRSNTSNVPKTMKEVAICVIGAHFRSNVEFWAHSRIALAAGVRQEVLDSIYNSEKPSFSDNGEEPFQKAAYDMAMEYLDGYRVSDETYQTVLDLLGSEKAMIELVLVMGHYIGLATQLNILRVPNPGDRQFFES
ncbi:MAG: hypothetical protein VX461_02175 [Candidatus Thermoplasmatota archaeon]|jgi:4-carboxymuconolactone decarboxylase|nr:hypothetical protein [Euryarchaeota archaeon]MEC7100819.1 hypothetical protein [Candidatus Thermoplasmatota archaeon]MEC7406532.1 hypothetical protein [Candidatus Thermoplasmatota archaeon]MEC7410606.1 hypothetical protein [Candidatus Thermoplasmatota archaeon]MEC7531939.1 hypothetical protein [Candidatus Thermoplasmatota archaeon]|tara:strand:+ start:6116 stop:6745 length:630 start_codon:yes stop_codon:yes gene_type:complete